MLIKIGLRDLSPAMVAFARVALAAAVLMPIAAAQGALSGLRGRLGRLALVGRRPGRRAVSADPARRAGDLVGARRDPRRHHADLHRAAGDPGRPRGALRGRCASSGIGIGVAGVVAAVRARPQRLAAAVLGGLAVVLAGVGYAVGSFVVKHRLSDAPATRRGRLGDGGERGPAAASRRSSRAPVQCPRNRADRRGHRPRCGRDRCSRS